MLSLTNRYSRLFLAQFLSRVGVLVLAVIAFGIITALYRSTGKMNMNLEEGFYEFFRSYRTYLAFMLNGVLPFVLVCSFSLTLFAWRETNQWESFASSGGKLPDVVSLSIAIGFFLGVGIALVLGPYAPVRFAESFNGQSWELVMPNDKGRWTWISLSFHDLTDNFIHFVEQPELPIWAVKQGNHAFYDSIGRASFFTFLCSFLSCKVFSVHFQSRAFLLLFSLISFCAWMFFGKIIASILWGSPIYPWSKMMSSAFLTPIWIWLFYSSRRLVSA
jgi:hypothetical protein